MRTSAVTVRRATGNDAQAIAEVMVATWRSAYRGMIPDPFLDSMSVADNRSSWLRHLDDPSGSGAVFVTEMDGRVIGFASGGRERDFDPAYIGELYAIYVLAAHQGSGLGRQLAAEVAGWLRGRGMSSMLVWVLRENGAARGFYERLGGVLVSAAVHQVVGLELNEVSYGWLDTAGLASATG